MGFELSYAGVPFHLATAEVQAEHIDRFIPPGMVSRFTPPRGPWAGKNLHGLAAPTWPDYPNPRLGEFFYPNGAARWSIFRGLAVTNNVAQMQAAAFDPVQGAKRATFTMRQDSGTVSTPLYMLPPVPLANHPAGNDSRLQGMYLVTLVDERYFWQWKQASLPLQDQDQTWADVLSLLQFYLGASINFSAIDPAYLSPEVDSDLFGNYENAAVLLDAVAFQLGLVVVREYDGINYNLLTPDDAQTRIGTNRPRSPLRRLAGGDALGNDAAGGGDPLNAILPQNVTVTFPKYIVPGDGSATSWVDERTGSSWIRDSYGDVYASTVSLAQAGFPDVAGFPGTKVFHDTAKAIYADSGAVAGPPDNQADLDALAVRLANDYYGWQQIALHEVYPGILPWQPDGFNDVLYCWKEGIVSTSLVPRPWNFGVEEFQHGQPVNVVGGGGGITVQDTENPTPTIVANVRTLTALTPGLKVLAGGLGEARLEQTFGGGVATGSGGTSLDITYKPLPGVRVTIPVSGYYALASSVFFDGFDHTSLLGIRLNATSTGPVAGATAPGVDGSVEFRLSAAAVVLLTQGDSVWVEASGGSGGADVVSANVGAALVGRA